MRLLFIFAITTFSFNILFAQSAETRMSKQEYDSIYPNISYAYELSQKSKYSDAIKVCQEILAFEKIKTHETLRGETYNVLGIVYTSLEDSKKAFTHFKWSIRLWVKVKDTSKLIVAYNNMGEYYKDLQNDISKSNKFYKKALELAQHPNYNYYIPSLNSNIAANLINREGNHNNKKHYNAAINYLLPVVDEDYKKNKLYIKIVRAEAYGLLGYAYLKIKNYDKASYYFDEGIKYAKENDFLEVLKQIYKDQVLLYGRQEEFNKQFLALQNLVAIKDSIYRVEKYDIVKTIESQYALKESEEQLKSVKKENELQQQMISKSKTYNLALGFFAFVLVITLFYVNVKKRELKLAKDKAQQLSKAKSDFYSEISHELRTPLYAVIELSNILLKERVDDTQKEYLESLRFSGNHLLTLINNVLELNKIESGKVRLEQIEFDLKNLITNIIDSLEYALSSKKNVINLNYDTNIPKALIGDSLKLSQILINLISNAIKFTDNGKIDVTITEVETNNDVTSIYFAVKDSGVGISLEHQKEIFEDYHQEEIKSKKIHKGTGLGLSIVKRLLQQMDSNIAIESKEQQGATFYFTLTFRDASKSLLVDKELTMDSHELHNFKFLVVDDNKINRLVTKKILHQLNLDCVLVDSGVEAIKAVKENNFDCILMDINMPEMNGYEATQKIRQFNKDVAIVALTATASMEIKKNIMFYEMDGHILKPFYIGNFIRSVTEGIEKRKAHALYTNHRNASTF